MRGIFIKIKNGEDFYNKDIMDANYEERSAWYKTLNKTQITSLLEKFVDNKIVNESN